MSHCSILRRAWQTVIMKEIKISTMVSYPLISVKVDIIKMGLTTNITSHTWRRAVLTWGMWVNTDGRTNRMEVPQKLKTTYPMVQWSQKPVSVPRPHVYWSSTHNIKQMKEIFVHRTDKGGRHKHVIEYYGNRHSCANLEDIMQITRQGMSIIKSVQYL